MKRYKLSQVQSWSLWEGWVLATSVALVIGLALVGVVSLAVSQWGYVPGIFLLVGTLEGIVLGFAQWLVLRRYIRHARRWIFATTIGALFAWFIGLTVSISMALAYANSFDTTATVTLMKAVVSLGAGLGTILGFCQWLVVKDQIRFSVLWIFANALAWSLGLLIAFVGAGMAQEGLNIQTALTTAVTGVSMGTVIGAITGIALVWLLKSRKKSVR